MTRTTVASTQPELNTATSPSPDTVGVHHAADLLNVSAAYVTELVRAGTLPHLVVDGDYQVRLADVCEHRDHMRVVRRDALAALVPEGGYDPSDF